MMNVIQLQDKLKNFSQDQLISAMQMPDGSTPQYLVLGEIMRRKQMESSAAAQQAPESTVAEDAVAAAGVPQGGIADMARALAPQTDMAQNTGVQAMARGGPVKKMAAGDAVDRKPPAYLTDETLRIMANRQGMSVDEYLSSVGPERAADIIADVQRRTADQVTSIPNAFNENLPVRGTQTGLDEFYPSFGQVKSEALAGLGANPTRSFGGADQYAQGMPELLTAEQEYAAANPTPELPSPGMNTREEAIAAGIARGGQGGMLDALLASGTPGLNAGQFLPPPAEAVEPASAADPMVSFGDPMGYFTDFGVTEGAGQAAEGGDSFMEMLSRALPARTSAPESLGPPGSKAQYLLSQPEYQVAAENRAAAGAPASSGPQGSKAQYLLSQPEYQVAAENRMPEGSSPQGFKSEYLRSQPAYQVAAENRSTPPDMAELARKSAEEAVKAREEAGITKSLEAPTGAKTAAETTPQGGRTDGGGAGGVSSYEQALMDALASREKAAKQDKWLALAQVGLNLMSSRSPTLLGALGEAGLKGVESARAARDQYDKDKLDLLGALEKSRMARAAAAASAARGASRKAIPEGALDMFDAEIEALSAAMSDPMLTRAQNLAASKRLDALIIEKGQLQNAYLAQLGIDSTGASPAATSGVVFEDVPS